MGWRKWALLNVALLALMILASRAALLIHEVGGHAVPAWVLGARKVQFGFSLFGGGYVKPEFPPQKRLAGWGHHAFYLGGLVLNLLTGAAAWFFVRRRRRPSRLVTAFLLFLGAGSLAQGLFYLGNGFYYGTGDPVGFVRPGGNLSPYQWMWLAFVPLVGGVAFFATGDYLKFLAGHAALDTAGRRFGWTLATLGTVTVVYAGLWGATWNAKVDTTLAERRVQEEIRKETARRARPPSTLERSTPPPPSAPVMRKDVEDRVPAPISTLALLFSIAAGAVVAMSILKPSSEPAELKAAWCLAPAALAAAVIAVFFAMRGGA
ncbi:MAG: hypothetical protein HY716_02130 [Planctomycetes bacterium]|nr:hypothetical protein [Planctomycetota bacterium]